MGLSRLDNFLKSTTGTILYVDPSSLDSTDSIDNQGNSLTRPFKTIQRALIEAARFSYQRGVNNDRFSKTTILVYPGIHTIDNRPGYFPDGSSFKTRLGTTVTDLFEWDLVTNFNINSSANTLFKLNSFYGGAIVPRGTSIIGLDEKKTIIRPKYIPNPENSAVERSAIFRLTGSSHIWNVTLLDADPQGSVYVDYTSNLTIPNFSHHKLSAFEYADGVNDISIEDSFQTYSTDRTDLEGYYQKLSIIYGNSTSRAISPDYPAAVDIEPIVDEYKIIGALGATYAIDDIYAGDGVTSTTEITVVTKAPFADIAIDTLIEISGINVSGYDGQYVVTEVVNSTSFKYIAANAPTTVAPSTAEIGSATVNVSVDTTITTSPEIHNCSFRTSYGMSGVSANGDKVNGFKSIEIHDCHAIGLQNDDNAFVIYNATNGTYNDITGPIKNLHSNINSKYKPDYVNFFANTQNDAEITITNSQVVGYAEQFIAESGSEISLINVASKFGSRALVARGYKEEAYARNDLGYVSHVIAPKEETAEKVSIKFDNLDKTKTVSVGSTNKLFFADKTSQAYPPAYIVDGYRLGAKENDTLFVTLSGQGGITTEYSARIVMPNTQGTGAEISSKKSFVVSRTGSGNAISSNIITLTTNHALIDGEKIRIVGVTGEIPDGLETDRIYFAIVSGVSANQLKVAKTLDDALSGTDVVINNKGGLLLVESRVSDKQSGDIGHPIQWDTTNSQWYVNVSAAATENTIYSALANFGATRTSYSYVTRYPDQRSDGDTIYQVRYVIPKESANASPPTRDLVIQESNTSIGSTSEMSSQWNASNSTELAAATDLRNTRVIADASWLSGNATITTELPHNLTLGSSVQVLNVTSTNNTTGDPETGFNGKHVVINIGSAKQFTYALATDPGAYTNNNSLRNAQLPYYKRKDFSLTHKVYEVTTIQEYESGVKDGIYHLTIVNSSVSPTDSYFSGERFAQDTTHLYPVIDRDNRNSDPNTSVSFAESNNIGRVLVNDREYSLTKEAVSKALYDTNLGVGITEFKSSPTGLAHTVYTSIDHRLQGISNLSIVSPGANYVDGEYYNVPLTAIGASITGDYATARLTVSAGSISSIRIMDNGSAYGIGNTLQIASGITTDVGHDDLADYGVVQVEGIENAVGETLIISGISSITTNHLNNLYKITGVSVGNTKQIELQASSTLISPLSTGIGNVVTATGQAFVAGKVVGVSTINYDYATGIATVGFTTAHGYRVGTKIRFGGATQSFYNKDVIVTDVVGLSTAKVSLGIGTNYPIVAGTIEAYAQLTSSYGGGIKYDVEATSGRLVVSYAGLTTCILAPITSSTDTETSGITVSNAVNVGLRLGDYFQINSEIFRVKRVVTSNTVLAFRGLLGTSAAAHSANSLLKRITPIPIELRRSSSIRSGGHYFEHVGFGPGNYSTGKFDYQSRTLKGEEVINAYSIDGDGGTVVFSGTNQDGDVFSGGSKIDGSSGEVQKIRVPSQTTSATKLQKNSSDLGYAVESFDRLTIDEGLSVSGGVDKDSLSKFDGPVIFNSKVASKSPEGLEVRSLFIQGEAPTPRKLTVGISTPVTPGSIGDIVWTANPTVDNYLGWIFTTGHSWEKYGYVGVNPADIKGVGISSAGTYIGFTTNLNITGTAVSITAATSASGITTLNIAANPRVAISTANNIFAGIATQINFIGAGVSISATVSAGIATVNFRATESGGGGGTPTGTENAIAAYDVAGNLSDVPALTYFNNILDLTSNTATTLFKINQGAGGNTLDLVNSGSGKILQAGASASDLAPIVFTTSKHIGVGTNTPGAGFDLRYRSGSGNAMIVRTEHNGVTNDIKFVLDNDGHIGIKTDISGYATPYGLTLDVNGNVGVTSAITFSTLQRDARITLSAPSSVVGTAYTLTLPTQVGGANSILYTSSSGVLGWITPNNILANSSTSSLPEGSNQYHTQERAQDAVGAAINAGIQTNITVDYDDANNRINFNVISGTFPYATRGFNIPIG